MFREPNHFPNPATNYFLRIGIVLAVIVAALAFAVRAQAQQALVSTVSIRPVVGALITVGSQHDAMKNGVVVGAQGAWSVDPNVAFVGTLAWSRSQEIQSVQRPDLNLYQYDVGVEVQSNNLTRGTSVVTRPYVAVGAGARTYDLQNVAGPHARTDPLLYSALGLELNHSGGALGIRLEGRDNITAFKGFYGELGDRTARHDLQISAGLVFSL
jgi:hypothetical protein